MVSIGVCEQQEMVREALVDAMPALDTGLTDFLGDAGETLSGSKIDGYAHIKGDSLTEARVNIHLALKFADQMKFDGCRCDAAHQNVVLRPGQQYVFGSRVEIDRGVACRVAIGDPERVDRIARTDESASRMQAEAQRGPRRLGDRRQRRGIGDPVRVDGHTSSVRDGPAFDPANNCSNNAGDETSSYNSLAVERSEIGKLREGREGGGGEPTGRPVRT